MKRFAALLVFGGLAPAATAAAAPVPLGVADAGQAAIAGDSAVLGYSSFGDSTVSRVPLAGGAEEELRNVQARRPGQQSTTQVAATADRAAALVFTAGRRGASLTNEAFGGALPAGPLAALAFGATFVPDRVAIAGTATIVEGRQGPRAVGARRGIEADGSAVDVRVPAAATFARFAGDLVAYGRPTGRETEEDPNVQLEVANWRTGEAVRSVRLPAGILGLDLRADGAVVVATDGAGVVAVRPGADVVEVVGAGDDPVWAGDRIVVGVTHDEGFDTLRVIEPDGTARAFGTPSGAIDGVTADAENVVWTANGCALTAPVADGAATALAPGGCPHAEAQLDVATPRLARTVPLPVRCLVATVACKGRVAGVGVRAGRFRVAPGEVGTATLRLERRAVARLAARRDPLLRVALYLRDGAATRDSILFR